MANSELFRMLADRAIENTEPTTDAAADLDYTTSAISQNNLDRDTPPKKFLSRISKSFRNLSWFKSEQDLNGTMVAVKCAQDTIKDNTSQQIFSPLHTCPRVQSIQEDDLPEQGSKSLARII